MQKVKSDGRRRFCHVISSPCSDAPFTPFLCHPEGCGARLLCVPSFKGTMTVAEAHGDPDTLHSIPDKPPLTIPPGLKQRFQPFGSLPPRAAGGGDSLLSGGTGERRERRNANGKKNRKL
ncbi:unnamed protein product, partial [Staurois parvus]